MPFEPFVEYERSKKTVLKRIKVRTTEWKTGLPNSVVLPHYQLKSALHISALVYLCVRIYMYIYIHVRHQNQNF